MAVSMTTAAPVESESPNNNILERQDGKTCSKDLAEDTIIEDVTVTEDAIASPKNANTPNGTAVDSRDESRPDGVSIYKSIHEYYHLKQ